MYLIYFIKRGNNLFYGYFYPRVIVFLHNHLDAFSLTNLSAYINNGELRCTVAPNHECNKI